MDPSSGWRAHKEQVLVGALVLCSIGMIARVVVPTIPARVHRTRCHETRADIRALEAAFEELHLVLGRHPLQLDELPGGDEARIVEFGR